MNDFQYNKQKEWLGGGWLGWLLNYLKACIVNCSSVCGSLLASKMTIQEETIASTSQPMLLKPPLSSATSKSWLPLWLVPAPLLHSH
jgi:hypothetical protein